MILDNQALFSSQQAVTATAASTNSIDITGLVGTAPGNSSALPVDIGKGMPIPMLVQVTETFNNLTSLKIDLEMDTTTTFTPDKTITLGTFLLAVLVAGWQTPFKFIPRGITMRYIQLKYTVTGTAPTTGKITAGVVGAVQEDSVSL